MSSSKAKIDIWHSFARAVVGNAAVLNESIEGKLYNVFANIPRSVFLPDRMHSRAFTDATLNINFGQQTWKPSLYARIMALVNPQKGERVLQVGSGSGYFSALLATTGVQVFAIEKIGLLAQQSRKTLDQLGCQGVLLKPGDGLHGWFEQGNFDIIIISTITNQIEMDLFQQLNSSGRLIALVGTKEQHTLCLWHMGQNGISMKRLESGVLF